MTAPFRRRVVASRDGGAGAGALVVTFTPFNGRQLQPTTLRTGPDDYAAARDVEVSVRSGADTVESLGSVSADDQAIHWARNRAAPAADNDALEAGPWIVYGPDSLRIGVANAAEGEELTVELRGMADGLVTAAAGTDCTIDTETD